MAGSETTIRVALRDGQGGELGSKEYRLAAYSIHQVNDIFSKLAVSARDNVRVTIAVTALEQPIDPGTKL